MPLPEITDPQIDAVIAAFGIQCDAERRSILRHRETVDVRACAGSGKTTLLVAKLALVLRNWSGRFSGIAILSHTNVAHEEIRRRFSIWPQLLDLEHYPHFLGTIQSFLNMTLGTPGVVRLFGVRPSTIDDAVWSRHAERLLRQQRYAIANGYLSRQGNGDALFHGLRWKINNAGLPVLESAGGELPGPDSDTTKQLTHLKRVLSLDGVFRYDDMNAIASWYAPRCPQALAPIVRRFPVVFMDEAQDTNKQHDDLLELVFGGRSVIQRFGDDRQAIYGARDGSEAGGSFPRTGYLSMTNSMRFGPSIAKLVQNVCGGTPEALNGQDGIADRAHTVFLFTPQTIYGVLPAFARHVATEVGGGLPAHKVMALGSRRFAADNPTHLPAGVGDYWAGDAVARRSITASFDSLADYVRASQDDVSGRSIRNARQRLLLAACRILELQGITLAGRPATVAALLKELRERDHKHAPRLLVSVSECIKACAAGQPKTIGAVHAAILNGLSVLHAGTWNNEVGTFAAAAGTIQSAQAAASDGSFSLAVGNELVKIGTGTIHSVKGETLEAVLVLTTYFNKKHDLQQLADAGILGGQRPSTAQARQKIFQGNLKLIYVAMTRPTKLLCLAMRADQITPARRAEMEQMGWSFCEVEAAANQNVSQADPGLQASKYLQE